MDTLFFRDGTEFTGQSSISDSGKPVTQVRDLCGRCGGAGGSEAWKMTGWTCFKCGGSRYGDYRTVPLYTADRLQKLDSALTKRRDAVRAKAEAVAEQLRTKANSRRAQFERANKDMIAWLEVAARNSAGEIREGFLGSMLQKALTDADWTCAQQAALQNCKYNAELKQAARAASGWLAAVGERIELDVTVERVHSFERPVFGASWKREVVYIVSMRDANGNMIVSKSTSFIRPEGARLKIRATVKEHTQFRDEKQTSVQRLKVLKEHAAEASSEEAAA